MQNLLSVGFDLPELKAQKEAVIEIVSQLYAQLNEFKASAVAPINITGLVQLNTSSQKSDEILTKLTKTVSDFDLQLRGYNSTAANTAILEGKLIGLYTDEAAKQAELKVAIAERNKALKESAQASNQDVQNRKIATELSKLQAQEETKEAEIVKKANADKIASETEWMALYKEANATANAVATQQIQVEKNESDAVVQANELKIQSETKWITLMEEAEAVANSVAAQQIKAEKAEAAAVIQSKQEQIAYNKRLQEVNDAYNRSKIQEAKNVLYLTDEYKQLALAQKDAERKFSNAFINSGGRNTPQVIAARENLKDINGSISSIDKEFDKVGSSGAAFLGKSLTGIITQVRYLAYIIPGIGMAGIFNLAFQAVEDFVGGEKSAIEKTKDLITANKDLNATFSEQISLEQKIKELLDAQLANQNASSKNSQFTVNALTSQGQNQLNVLQQQDIVSKQNFADASKNIDEKGGTVAVQKSVDTLISNIQSSKGELEKVQNFVSDYQKLLARGLDNAQIQFYAKYGAGEAKGIPNIDKIVELSKKVAPILASGDKRLTEVETAKEYAAKLKSDIDVATQRAQEGTDLLNKFYDTQNQSSLVTNQIEKYQDDETRKTILDNITQEVNAVKSKNSLILQNETSTQKQRIQAINEISAAEVRLAEAQKENVLKNISSSDSDKTVAINDAGKATEESLRQRNAKIRELNLQFYEKQAELDKQNAINLLQTQELINEAFYKDDDNSYSERLTALSIYIEKRKEQITQQYEYEVDLAKKTTPPDLLPKKLAQLDSQKDNELLQVTNSVNQDIFSVVDSWYKKQLTLITDSKELEVTKTKEAETKELTELNASYDNKEISYKRYAEKKRKLEQQYLEKTDLSQIDDDERKLQGLLSLRAELTEKTLEAERRVTNATTPEDKTNAGNELQDLVDKSKDLDSQINAAHSKSSDDKLKYEEDKNKLIAEGKKELNANLIELEDDALNDIKDIVDAEYEYRIDKIQKLQDAYDKQIDAEKDAIDRSTLNQKDKTAYEIQLTAQKEASDKAAAKEERKLKHDEAVFNRDESIAEIILNTEVAITQALKIPVIGEALAFSYAALGAAALVTALAVRIPSFAKGVKGFEGGFARFGEAGVEKIKEPNRQPYYAFKETIEWLPKGTDIIPMYEVPTISTQYKDNSWEQTKYLGKMISKGNASVKNVIKNNINIDLGYQSYKFSIIHGEG